MCGLRTRPLTDVDPPRVELPSAGMGHIISPSPGDNFLICGIVVYCVESIRRQLSSQLAGWIMTETLLGKLVLSARKFRPEHSTLLERQLIDSELMNQLCVH